MAGFGVTQAHPGFAALPGVAAEMDTIFGDVGVLGGQTALDAGFDERSLKKVLLRKPGILHIASHFNLPDRARWGPVPKSTALVPPRN